MNNIVKSLLLVLVLLIFGGCSSESLDPVTTPTDDGGETLFTGVADDNHNHKLWTSGTINIDPETMTAEVVPDRESNAHYEVGIDAPVEVIVNSIDTVNWVADVDVKITNNSGMAGFDVRFIVMASSADHRLLNSDDWTALFDETDDGYPINPFKAYAKDQPSREFLPGFDYTENLLVSIPGGNTNVRYTIDASYPGNCEEPYEINGFMHEELLETPGSMSPASVDVIGWNDDADMVVLYLPEVTGTDIVYFALDSGNHWVLDLANDAGAAAGEYVGYIKATTTGSGDLALFDEVVVTVTEAVGREYVGSDRCGMCHSSVHNEWSEHGHPYKLNKVEGGTPPTYPFTSLPPNPPAGYTWDDTSYVIGGYGWKARWIDSEGYIITGDEVQWNFQTETWSAYHAEDPPGTKPYNCGTCHTTGWVATGENGPHQDGLPGMWGTFAEQGIACEACHGPGSEHVAAPSPSTIEKDPSSELCGSCHVRGDLDKVLVSGNLVRHHEQYNEFLGSPHANALECGSCHDPHASGKYDDEAVGVGHIADCTDCHSAANHTVQGPMAALACTDCHMPLGAKSAVSTGEGVHKTGDVPNHIFQIDTSGVTLEDHMETDGSSTWIGDIDGELKLNLAWACMQCHDGAQAFEIENYALAAARATDIHNPAPENSYVGSEVCGGCHDSKHNLWEQSGHPYKLNKIVDSTPPEYPWTTLPANPPVGYTWDDTTYVIGGYGWKARFLDADGWIITGDEVQWNFQTQGWSAYHAEDPPGTKPYDCGTCHTTGWIATGEAGPHQDDLPGIWGTFEEQGIGCEACHGMGNDHIRDPGPDTIQVDDSAALCGTCHVRGDLDKILTSGNLVRHHEQYNELLASPHSFYSCNTCHDPHSGTKYDDLADGDGVTKDCTDCHSASSHQVSGSMATLDCIDCHMPYATKSAVSFGDGVHKKGDLRNHIFRIDTTGVMLEDYFETDGSSTWIGEIDGAVRLNLAYSCMQCHDGNDAFEITSYGMAAGFASGIHD